MKYRGASYDENGIPDWAETQSTLEQINEIMAIADEEFRQGALSAGSTMGYMAKGPALPWKCSITRKSPPITVAPAAFMCDCSATPARRMKAIWVQ